MERSLQAAWNGYAAYLVRLKASGEKRPSGRRKGRAWVTARMWEKRLANAFNVSPELAAQVARELVEHLKETEIEKQMLGEIKAIMQGFEK